MQLRPLGSSGLLVSPICLGTMTFGSPVEGPAAEGLIHAALDLGINFIDTANVYEGYRRFLGSPGGVAEEIVGRALKGRRDKAIVATKVGAPVGPGPQDRGLSPVHVLREVDRSLRRLQTDTIDLYIAHWPDREVPLETTLAAMEVAVRQGKIRCFGVSNHTAWQMAELRALADRGLGPRLVSSQIPFSLLRREFQHDLEYCRQRGIGVTPYQALQGGLLTGKYHRGSPPPADSRLAEKPEWMWKTDDALYDRLDTLRQLATEAGIDQAGYALAWALTQPAMSSLIVGVKTRAQIEQAIAAASLTIPPGHFPRIDQAFPGPWKQPDPLRG